MCLDCIDTKDKIQPYTEPSLTVGIYRLAHSVLSNGTEDRTFTIKWAQVLV